MIINKTRNRTIKNYDETDDIPSELEINMLAKIPSIRQWCNDNARILYL